MSREKDRGSTLSVRALTLLRKLKTEGAWGWPMSTPRSWRRPFFQVLEGAETQGETENDRGDGLPPSELPAGAGGGAQALENAPHVQASQSRVEQQCSGVTREAAFAQADRGHRGGILGLGRRGGFQRQGRLLSLGRPLLEQGRHAAVGDSSARARHALGDGPRR